MVGFVVLECRSGFLMRFGPFSGRKRARDLE